VVLEITRLEYHRPYEETRVQHAVLGTTQIGHAHERSRTKHSRTYHKLHKISKSITSDSQVDTSAQVIIRRLVEKLDLPRSLRKPLFTKYKQARSEFEPGTKFRNPEKLIPGILYYHCKFNCFPIDERILLENSEIGKKDFYELKLNVIGIMPKYYTRDRQAFIKTRLMQLKEEYQLDMAFYHDASRILAKLWEGIKCTKDDVIAGLVASIVILCHKKYDVNVNSICNHLNIQMSTIHSQVRRRFFEPFGGLEFRGLVSSADILKTIMKSLGFFNIEPEIGAVQDKGKDHGEKNDKIKDIQKVKKSFEDTIAHKNEGCAERTILLLKQDTDEISVSIPNRLNGKDWGILAVGNPKKDLLIMIKFKIVRDYPTGHIYEFEIDRYYLPKGPPQFIQR
jgi:hypothetical protein